MALTLALYNLLQLAPSLWHPPAQLLLPLLYAVLAATILTYSLVSWANQHTSATVVAASWTLQPLASALLSYLFLAQLVVLRQVAGAALILSGFGSRPVAAPPRGRRRGTGPGAGRRGRGRGRSLWR